MGYFRQRVIRASGVNCANSKSFLNNRSGYRNAAADVFAVVKSGLIFYAFYQASDGEGLPAATLTGYSGFYLSIGLAESDDNGYTWVKKGQIIKCQKPKEWAATPQQGVRGIGQPGGLADTSGKRFYIYYTDLSTSRAGQINVARCSLDDGPPLLRRGALPLRNHEG